jgi:hypothetical protein
VGGSPRKLLTNSLRTSMHASRIEGRNNVTSPRTTRSFENNAIESTPPSYHVFSESRLEVP